MIPDHSWTEEKLFFDGDAFYKDVFENIENARSTIEFETYIFQKDHTGHEFEQAFERAAKRGVKVRLIVDGYGSATWIAMRTPELTASGVQLRIYHPIRLAHFFSRLLFRFGRVKLRSAQHDGGTFARLNRRTHRKICIIDAEVAWVGSLNVADSHSARFSGEFAWRDTAVRVRGLAGIMELLKSFNNVWLRSHNTKGRRRWRDTLFDFANRRTPVSKLLRLNHKLSLRRKNFHDFNKRIRRAKTRVWLTNAYFAPSRAMTRGLVKAAKNGVDVRLLVPRKSDVFFMPWVAGLYYHTLVREGVKIYEYLPRFLHAKSAIIDDWAIVGTSNLNRRSHLHDFEVDVALTKPESREELAQQYLKDLKDAEQITRMPGNISWFFGRVVEFFLRDLI